MIRQDAIEALLKWRDILVGGAIIVLGLWSIMVSFGVLMWLGWLAVAAGVLFLWTGWQRLRFSAMRDGPGVVTVTEGQISYFGPLTGGAIARSNLNSLDYDPSGKPAHWVLGHSGGPDLHIPVTASGADALFDYFSSLPGIRIERLLRAANGHDTLRTRLWQREEKPLPDAITHQ